ncbi:rRNA 2'-O-methyltransferase fibrillarin [Drosophila elegans]|uniref:rRNA 2'-O-methyltransferase fibrillarin n=1 Tax=Drosophila elegans TaxID=30023 RepID=UPI0007E6C2C7|nr:rRNA 2'-O-methyltransferase fibrillarin [Drosophila elegans]
MSMESSSRRWPRITKARGGGAPKKIASSEPAKFGAKVSGRTPNKSSIIPPDHSSYQFSNKHSAKISDKTSTKGIELQETDKEQNKVKDQGQIQGHGRGEGKGQEVTVVNPNRIEPHRHPGVFLSRNRFDAIQLLTRNSSSSMDDYGEHRIVSDFRGKRCEFRAWSPFQSKLAAGIMGGASELHLRSGSKVLYLGAGFGRSVSHISDIVGESGVIYAVERGPWADRQLAALASRRPNIVPVIEDAILPYKYRLQVPASIDIIFSDLPHSDQVRALTINARHFLIPGGHFVAYLHADSCIGGVPSKEAFTVEWKHLKEQHLEPVEQIALDPYKPGYVLIMGVSTRKAVSS